MAITDAQREGNRPSAVRLFAPEHPALTQALRATLEARRRELAAQIADGYAQSWEDYKYRSGRVAGLDEAIAVCADLEKKLES